MTSAALAHLDLRLRLGADALLSIDEAAILLPVPENVGRGWIEANVRRTLIAGVASVRWADVLRAVEAAEPKASDTSADVSGDTSAPRWLSTQEAADLLGVNRKTLDCLARANLDLPGGPVVVGGRKRIHLRWPATGLDTWLAAVRFRASEPVKPRARASRAPRAQPDDDTPTDWSAVRRRLLGS